MTDERIIKMLLVEGRKRLLSEEEVDDGIAALDRIAEKAGRYDDLNDAPAVSVGTGCECGGDCKPNRTDWENCPSYREWVCPQDPCPDCELAVA